MGLCASNMSPEDRAELERSRELEAKVERDHEESSRKIKLLLLGPGESGKTTFFRQFKILYGTDFTEAERSNARVAIYNNTILSMKTLIDSCETLGLAIECREEADEFMEVDDEAAVDASVAALITKLWEDPGVRAAYERRSEFQLPDSAEYFFENVTRMAEADYIPSVQDVLRMRVRTSGIITERYRISDTDFEIYDVGGQRNERRKWIHCFDNVTAILFVAAMSEYDQVLYEDNTENRMVEAINLFDEICNSSLFIRTPIMLFLNKADLFQEKIKTKDIRQPGGEDGGPGHFLDYDGGCDAEAGELYIKNQFQMKKKSASQLLYMHVTTATNTENVENVFEGCKQVLLNEQLENSGFL